MLNVQVKILDQKIGKSIAFPTYATAGSAGIDLSACIDNPIKIKPNQTIMIGTGIAIHIADPEYAAIILPRSGLGHKHGIILGNSIGLIDSDYQGELKVSCWNRSSETFTLNPGDRFAQLMFTKVFTPTLETVTEFAHSDRAGGGFGSTGINALVAEVTEE
jgi:dUTP pyrophosphatase